MQKSMRIVMALALVGFVAACAQKAEEEVVYVDEPVSVEPTYTGKYK
ncbi:hypothetical protein [Rhodobacter sp. SGA-6-6]|nr:hypothetical protein [Rhodobacter sp. SGA-6-6]